jgi:hypothetical protein
MPVSLWLFAEAGVAVVGQRSRRAERLDIADRRVTSELFRAVDLAVGSGTVKGVEVRERNVELVDENTSDDRPVHLRVAGDHPLQAGRSVCRSWRMWGWRRGWSCRG